MSHTYQGKRRRHKARRWTREEDNYGKELLKTGLTCMEVGRVLGRSKSAIVQRNRDVWKINITRSQPWTLQEEDAARKMLLSSLSYRETAQSLKRTQRAVVKKNFRDWGIVNVRPRRQRRRLTNHSKYLRRRYDDLGFNGNRVLCLIRDEFRCQDCGIQDYGDTILNVHHLNGKRTSNADNNLENLITLCVRCHTKRHKNHRREEITCQ